MTCLLLLPGFDGTGALYEPLVAALPSQVDSVVVSYDDYDSLSGYAAVIRERCPQDRPVIVVAESFSGPLGLDFLAASPSNVVGGVFSATFAKPPLSLIISLAEKLRLASFTLPAVSEQILRWFCLNGVSDIALIKTITQVVRGVGGRTVQSRLGALTEMDATPQLTQIHKPVMTLSAANDRVVRPRFMQSLMTIASHHEHHDIPGPHLLLQARAQEAVQHIVRFGADISS
ncbi:MAG: alpha/beta hydrolase [Pseudomonadota bacterium]